MPGLNAERTILRSINNGTDEFELLEQAVAARLLPAHGPESWLRDRVRFLGSAMVTALRFGLDRSVPGLGSGSVVFDSGNSTERVREVRAFFLDHHFGHAVDFLGGGVRKRVEPSGSWWGWYWRGVWWSLLALLDFSKRRYTWVGPLLVDIQQYARALPGIERVFVFGLYHRRAYLIGTWLARHTDREVVFVYQNIPLARNCSYLHVRVPAVLTSRVNVAEAAYFQERGTFLAREVVYAGQEYAIDTVGLAQAQPIYDIGFYSSGEWARRDGLYQYDSVEQVRRGEFVGNVYDRASRDLLEALVSYARSSGRTLRIYLHPMERRLANDFGIEPPYASLADGELVSLETAEGDSRRSMYECRVAVSLQSSFIWERLDLGLRDSFIYEFADPDLNVFYREALGEYADKVFASAEEMLGKVDAALTRRPA